MIRVLLSEQPKNNVYNPRIYSRKDFIEFVSKELKKIAKKNLKIPVSLYHL